MTHQAEQPNDVIRGAWMRIDTLLRQDPAGAGMEAAANLVADLRHWCDAKGISFDDVIALADENHSADQGRDVLPPAPATRVLNALAKARPILVREGVPAKSLNAFERALIEGINEQFATVRPTRMPPADVFEQSVMEVARDQWMGGIRRDLTKGLTAEQVYRAAIDRLAASSLFGPTRSGAVRAIEQHCRDHNLPGDELANFRETIKPQSLGDKLRRAASSRMSVR